MKNNFIIFTGYVGEHKALNSSTSNCEGEFDFIIFKHCLCPKH